MISGGNKLKFSEELKSYRKSKGWNMTYVSDTLGVPYTTYQNWEASNNEPPAYTKRFVMEKLGRIAKGEM